MKDLRDIADIRESYCTAIPQHHQRILNKRQSTISVFQYVLNLTPGNFRDTLTVLSLWEKVRAIAEIRRRCLFVGVFKS